MTSHSNRIVRSMSPAEYSRQSSRIAVCLIVAVIASNVAYVTSAAAPVDTQPAAGPAAGTLGMLAAGVFAALAVVAATGGVVLARRLSVAHRAISFVAPAIVLLFALRAAS